MCGLILFGMLSSQSNDAAVIVNVASVKEGGGGAKNAIKQTTAKAKFDAFSFTKLVSIAIYLPYEVLQ